MLSSSILLAVDIYTRLFVLLLSINVVEDDDDEEEEQKAEELEKWEKEEVSSFVDARPSWSWSRRRLEPNRI